MFKKDFKLREVMGKGSYGTVIKATLRETKKSIAIKKIKCSFKDIDKMKYILREISILRQFSNMKNAHLFFPQLMDIVIPEESFDEIQNLSAIFILMEFEPNSLGNMIKECLKNEKKINEKDVLTLMYNLLCGMKFMHSAGIMHRDVKPDNILINQKGTVMFCDFGLSRGLISDEEEKSEISKFMSPESKDIRQKSISDN